MSTAINSIEIPGRFLRVCEGWYDGQDDLLYAITSSGGLTTGNIRPLGCTTDEQWYLQLWRELSCDLGRAARLAESTRGRFKDCLLYVRDASVLTEFENWVDELCDTLADEYNLENWGIN